MDLTVGQAREQFRELLRRRPVSGRRQADFLPVETLLCLAACPPHDVAFDTGLLTVNGGLRIRVARSLADAVPTDQMAPQDYGPPPPRESVLLPPGPLPPPPKNPA